MTIYPDPLDELLDEPRLPRTRTVRPTRPRVLGRTYGWSRTRWVAYFYLQGFDRLQLGFHVSFAARNAELHVPFGFFRVGLNPNPYEVRLTRAERLERLAAEFAPLTLAEIAACRIAPGEWDYPRLRALPERSETEQETRDVDT